MVKCIQQIIYLTDLGLNQWLNNLLNWSSVNVNVIKSVRSRSSIKETSVGLGVTLGANLSSLLSEKAESSAAKLSQDDLRLCCVLLSSAEYCLETAVQLEEKLKSKINSDLQAGLILIGDNKIHNNHLIYMVSTIRHKKIFLGL